MSHKTSVETFTRRVKVAAFGAKRFGEWLLRPAQYPAPVLGGADEEFPFLVYQKDILISRKDPGAHPLLEAGKKTNLRLAAPSFHGLLVTPTRPLSFWRTLGRVTEALGYQYGMELQGGCVVPALGGGLCLLSNALFEMAARCGWNILERYGHTMEAVPHPPNELWGLDATVFYPYVDLRISPRSGKAKLHMQVAGDVLRFSVYADAPLAVRVILRAIEDRLEQKGEEKTRYNKIVREVFDKTSGQRLEEEIIAVNQKKISHQVLSGRSCLTCGDTTCSARPAFIDNPKRRLTLVSEVVK